MVTVAEIANKAVSKAALAVTDAVQSAELFESVQGIYDPVIAGYTDTELSRGTCSAIIDTVKPLGDVFPDLIAGPNQMLIFLTGLSVAPVEGWTLRMGGTDYTITKAQDILLSGSIAYVAVQ